MRKLFILGLGILMVSMVSCQTNEQNSLTATASNIDDGTPVYISELTKGNVPKPIDTVEVENGKITVQLPKVDFQTLDFLKIKGVNGTMLFFNENKPLQATIYKDSLRRSAVTGGPANEMYSNYRAEVLKNNRQLQQLAKAFSRKDLSKPSVKQQITAKRQQVVTKNNTLRKKLIKNNPDQLPSIFIYSDLMRTRKLAYNELKPLFDGLSDEVKSTSMGQQIDNRLAQSEATSIGSKAPGFKAKTPDGKELALKDVLSGSKYTLVDFWASWCKPCRHENPNVVRVYKEYHDKGLNILGVSLDKKHSSWTKAIAQDGLLWPQISHLKFWQDPIARKYNVRAIPTNFLLDQNGKIVAKNLRGSALDKKMKELLGQP